MKGKKAQGAGRKVAVPVVEMVALAKLQAWDKNPRKGHAIDGIAKSISKFGYVSPIIVQKGTYRILAGHGRYQALQKLGVQEIPVMVMDLPDDAADQYTIADNRFTDLSEFDEEMLAEQMKQYSTEIALAIGFDEKQLEELISKQLEEQQLQDVSIAPPPRMTWVLIGIPTVRFGEISDTIEALAAQEGVVLETTSNNG